MGASAADVDLQVSVHTLGGEAAVPLGPVPSSTTVGELLQSLREWDAVYHGWGGPHMQKLLLGGRRLAAHERLGDLEVPDGETGLALTVVREAVDTDLVGKFRANIDGTLGMLSLSHLSEDAVGHAELSAIAYLLAEPGSALKDLILFNCEVVDLTPIIEALWLTTSLERLSFIFTKVSDISKLADALRVNRSLMCIDAYHNSFKDVGGLVEALRENQTLKGIALEHCGLPEGLKQELRCVQQEKNQRGVSGTEFVLSI